MEFVTTILSPLVESLLVPIKKHLGYLISSKKYVKDMGTKMKELEGKEVDVKTQMRANNIGNLEIPTRVPDWLDEVIHIKEIKKEVESISNTGGGCFNVKMRYNAGKRASMITTDIDRLIKEESETKWNNRQKPLGRVNSKSASTSAPMAGVTQNDFESRDQTFKEVLKALQPRHKTQMVALLGMGGVGKTTMIGQLKNAVEDKKMFYVIVKATIGEKTNPIAVQQAIAEYLGLNLTETTKEARADRLRKSFEALSGKMILVILDDIWEMVDLKDIGLSPLANGDGHFKFLLASRHEDVCRKMGVETDSIFRVDVMKDHEAQNFFCKHAGISNDVDQKLNLNQTGKDIVKRCGGLPLAIKTIAVALKNKPIHVWSDTLLRLMNNDLVKNVREVFEISYNNLERQELKDIFFLCGLFPEDFDIPVEELLRYAWGLRLLDRVSTFREARNRVTTCVEEIISANLLLATNIVGCVKMHDLVRSFVLSVVSEGEHAWIVNHNSLSEWPIRDMNKCCKRISLTCTGMSMFPGNFNYPNLALLKLMHGDRLLFPDYFYGGMENLEVIAYENVGNALFPRSLQYPINLRVLCLHSCSLIDDFPPLENLIHLEVLSFAHCRIRKLPSTIGKLRKLKLLDLTGCDDFPIVDDGIFENLVCLEELYMKIGSPRTVRFTDASYDELEKLSSNLNALEVEFFENMVDLKNVSFKNLKRFRISMGRYLSDKNNDRYSFENTLDLHTNLNELLECGINELFGETEILSLEVQGMNNIEDVLMEPLHVSQYLFNNLRVLDFTRCKELIYLFTFRVAKRLSNLESLTISWCPVIEELIHVEISGEEPIRFHSLKFLSLQELPKLVSLCNTLDLIELPELVELRLESLPNFTSIYPGNTTSASSVYNNTSAMQPFLNEEVSMPKLEKLEIEGMEKLKEIWPCQLNSSEEDNVCTLREIIVAKCVNLVNLFPSNPMPLLHHLEELLVEECGSIEVIFDFDLECVHEGSSNLRHIEAKESGKLREVWRMKGVNNSRDIILGFQAVKNIEIIRCKSFKTVFTPTTANFDLGALEVIEIIGCEHLGESGRNNELAESSTSVNDTLGQQQQFNVVSKGETLGIDDNIANVAFPSLLIPTFHQLQTLQLQSCKGVEVVFEIESGSSREFAMAQNNQQPLLLPQLQDLYLKDMKRMSHVWKCNWNKFLIPHQHPPESPFHNLTSISMVECRSIKYLFSPLMAKLLTNIKNVYIYFCFGIEEIVSSRDDEDKQMSPSIHTNIVFPRFDTLELDILPCLKHIGGGSNAISSNMATTTTSIRDGLQHAQVAVASWSLCQYSRKIEIKNCNALSSVIPSHAVGHMQKLQELIIDNCESMIELFETKRANNTSIRIDEGSGGSRVALTIPRLTNMASLELPNLRKLCFNRCTVLGHIFTFSTLESLKQLEELEIENCETIQVIVKEEDRDHATTSKVVVFPCLKSLILVNLPNLKGFFLGMNDFRWPLLDMVKIGGCPEMVMFTLGHSMASKLKYIHTILGKHSLECGLNFNLTTALHETPFPSLDSSSSCPILKRMPWSFSNLIEIDLYEWDGLRNIVPSSKLLQLQELQKIKVNRCQMLEIFETFSGANSDLNESHSIVKFPKLREVNLKLLESLKYIWKSNQWTVLEFPSLTRVSIWYCKKLEHVFTYSMVGSLLQLQELEIIRCHSLEVSQGRR